MSELDKKIAENEDGQSDGERLEPAYRWTFDKFERHERGTLWYVIAGLVVGGLLVYSIATANILFGVIIFLTVVIIFGRHMNESEMVSCEIYPDAIVVDDKRYPYQDIRTFSIITTSEGAPILYLYEGRGLRHHVPIPLADQDPLEIREYLLDVVEEDVEHLYEPIWDRLTRKLKL